MNKSMTSLVTRFLDSTTLSWDILTVPDTMRDVSERQKSCTRAKIAFEDAAGVREESKGEERRRVERRGEERGG